MKSNVIMLLALVCQIGGCPVYGEKPQPVTFTVDTTIITNEVSESEWNARTNDHVRTDVVMRAPFFANTVAWAVTNCVSVNGYNIYPGGAAGPDPFEEKVTVTYFSKERQDVYYIQVGSITEKYATQWTALDRWKTVHRQKLNMSESVETLRE